MPKRQLPNTDAGRNQALTAAKTKKDNTAPADIVLTPNTISRLDAMQPLFYNKLEDRANALTAQATATNLAQQAKEKTVIYISHFIQGFNFGVTRGLFPAQDRAYYHLNINSDKLPTLDTVSDILMWGQYLTDGDTARIAAGGAPMGFPSISEVENVFNDFKALNINQSTLKDAYDNAQEAVEDMREEADKLILRIWDEVETAYNDEEPPSLRRKARQWGVVYVASPGEEPLPPVTDAIVFSTNQSIPGQITLELAGKDGKEVTISWGDNSSTPVVLQSNYISYPYTYATPGNYTLHIEGTTIAISHLKGKNNHITATNLPEEGLFLIEIVLPDNEQGSFHVPDTYILLKHLDLKNNHLDLQSTNSILVTFDGFGTNDGYIDLRGPNMATPTGDGLLAKANLESRGWTVKTN